MKKHLKALSIFALLSIILVMVFGVAPQKAGAAAICSPATSISSPYSFDGAGDYCWKATSLCTYINSWNLTTLEVNGTAYTNLYVAGSSIAPVNGVYTIHYNSTVAWGHFEIAGTCSSVPTNTPTAVGPTVTRTKTPVTGITSTMTKTPTTGGPTITRTNTPVVSVTPTKTKTPVGPSPTTIPTQPPSSGKPRMIVLTDGEVDDRSSMIRFLMYTSDFDVNGIVQTNSKFQKNGHSKEKWLEAQLTQYEALLPRLRIHNPNYPSGASLRNVSKVGNENINDLNVAPPNMATKDTPGSQLIIDTLLDSDPRPVHVAVWGGANTVAYALWKLKTSYTPAQFQYAASRVRIYAIWYQDGGGQWIEDNIKEAYINEAYKWDNVWDYQSVSGTVNPAEVKAVMNSTWLNANVKTGHGSLGAMTPQTFVSEGDTPSFLHLINNGLLADMDYTLGGWGGRSRYDDKTNKPNHVTDQSGVTDDGNANKAYWRWVIDTQNDFAARMDYCIAATYSGANHPPVANIVGSLTRTVAAGSTITLDGSPSIDPDGNSLSYLWWQYYDADSVSAKVIITNSTARSGASFVVPNEPGKQIHIIFEVKDNGSPSLKSYRRIILNIQ